MTKFRVSHFLLMIIVINIPIANAQDMDSTCITAAQGQTAVVVNLNEQINSVLTVFSSKSLKEKIENISQKVPIVTGANCWNTALRISGFLPYARYSNSTEFKAVLNGPSCMKLKNKEARLPGDIVALRTRNTNDFGGEAHTAIYLGGDKAFAKEGPDAAQKFSTLPLKDIYASVRVEDFCTDNDSGQSDKCSRYTTWYRCKPTDPLQLVNSDSVKLRTIEESILNFEKLLEESVLYKRRFTEEEIKKHTAMEETIIETVREYCTSPKLNPQEVQKAQIFFTRLSPISKQLLFLNEKDLMLTFSRAGYQTEQILKSCGVTQ